VWSTSSWERQEEEKGGNFRKSTLKKEASQQKKRRKSRRCRAKEKPLFSTNRQKEKRGGQGKQHQWSAEGARL